MYEELTFNDSGLPNEIASASAAQNLYKALTAGDSANPGAMGTSGNTLQFESLEPQLVSALAERPEDFKLMRLQPKRKVGSTVHQYTQEQESGSYEGIGTAELGDPIESNAEFARITRNMKYFQTKREVSLQAVMLNPTLGGAAEATEERLGAHVLLKGTEYFCFHGDTSASPNLPDGYPQMIRNEASQNVVDMAGLKVSDTGAKAIIDDTIRAVYEQGGEVSDMFFPPIIAKDFMNLLEDRMRYNASSRVIGEKLISYQTSYGKDVWISGRAGVDKMYKVKGVPVASTLSALRPTAPTIVGVAQATTGGTGFIAATAGTYRYSVFAVDASGLISVASNAVNVVLAAGQEAKITITKGAAPLATGYIVTRGKKDVTTGLDQREMYRIADSGATTITLDQNDEYPGTAEILMLTSDGFTPTYQWDSFMDLMRFDLGRVKASQPFLEVWYGTPDLKIAKQNAIIKNLGHADIDWF